MKDRKKPTEHRQGNLVKLLDLMQRFSEMQYDTDFFTGEFNISEKHKNEIKDMMLEIRKFDIKTIGDLYFTSGGRVVLDKGYGEYFGESDKVIFTLNELISGMNSDKFIKRLNEVIK